VLLDRGRNIARIDRRNRHFVARHSVMAEHQFEQALSERQSAIVLRQIWRRNLLRHADLSGIRLGAGLDGE
jgi:hypothetical protein